MTLARAFLRTPDPDAKLSEAPPGRSACTFMQPILRRQPKRRIRDWFRVIECARLRARDCRFDRTALTPFYAARLRRRFGVSLLQRAPFRDPLRTTAHRGGPPALSLFPRRRREPRSESEMLRPGTQQTTNNNGTRESVEPASCVPIRRSCCKKGETGGGSAKAPTPIVDGIHATTIRTRSARPGCPRTERRHRFGPLPQEQTRCRDLGLWSALPHAHHPCSRVFQIAIRRTEVLRGKRYPMPGYSLAFLRPF